MEPCICRESAGISPSKKKVDYLNFCVFFFFFFRDKNMKKLDQMSEIQAGI